MSMRGGKLLPLLLLLLAFLLATVAFATSEPYNQKMSAEEEKRQVCKAKCLVNPPPVLYGYCMRECDYNQRVSGNRKLDDWKEDFQKAFCVNECEELALGSPEDCERKCGVRLERQQKEEEEEGGSKGRSYEDFFFFKGRRPRSQQGHPYEPYNQRVSGNRNLDGWKEDFCEVSCVWAYHKSKEECHRHCYGHFFKGRRPRSQQEEEGRAIIA